MTDLIYHEAKLLPLIGAVDGDNREFITISAYLAGSFKLFWNGVLYDPADDRFGWEEVTDNSIRTRVAPHPGDLLQAFYRELCEVPGIGNCYGSPFDPNGVIP